MVDFKLDSLATLPSVLDQWHLLLGMLCLVGERFYVNTRNPYLEAWIIIIGIFALVALIIVILGIVGKELPKQYLFWWYILGGLMILIIDGLTLAYCGAKAFDFLCFCLAFTMSIFYLYSAYLAKKG